MMKALPGGRRTVNAEPLPGPLATVTSPPIMRASLRVMASPSHTQTTQDRLALTMTHRSVLPSDFLHSVGTPDYKLFAA
jgi:hypothetical protein